MKTNARADRSHPCPAAMTGKKLPPFVPGSVMAPEVTTTAPTRKATIGNGERRGRRENGGSPVLRPAGEVSRHRSGVGEGRDDERDGSADGEGACPAGRTAVAPHIAQP